MRTVILPPGSRRNAFNWFIGNINGHNQIEANNEFGVLNSAITQAALDQKLIDYAADLATVHSDYDTFLADTADEEFRVVLPRLSASLIGNHSGKFSGESCGQVTGRGLQLRRSHCGHGAEY